MTAVDPEGRIRHPLDVFHSTFNPDGTFVPAGYVATADGLGQVEYVDSGTLTGSSGGFDVTPSHSFPLPPWVKPTGSGQVTADAQGKLTVDSGANYKSFPGATYLEGCLYVVYREGTAHNSGASSIKMRRSYDLGRTWGTAVTVLSVAGTDDLRDPNIVALSSGRLLLSYDTRNPYTGTDIHAFTGYSDDRGQTWTTGIAVTDSFSGSGIASGQAVELPNGTILLPGFGDNGGQYVACVWKSTDGGLTFGSQVTIATGTHDWEEPVIRLLASGSLVALVRDSLGSVTYRVVSADLGATWGSPASVLTGGGRPDFVEFYPGALALFFRGNNSTTTQGRYATSWDEGATWTSLSEVDTAETKEWEYSAPVLLTPGYLAVIYSLENSAGDADLFLRYYHDGYGMDPLGNISGLTVSPGGSLTVKDEGSNLDTAVTSIDFVGAGVVATNVSHAVTVTIGGATAGQLLIADTHSTPLVFADLIQTEAQDDLLYAD